MGEFEAHETTPWFQHTVGLLQCLGPTVVVVVVGGREGEQEEEEEEWWWWWWSRIG